MIVDCIRGKWWGLRVSRGFFLLKFSFGYAGISVLKNSWLTGRSRDGGQPKPPGGNRGLCGSAQSA